ncbi:MAG: 1-(5-phosphoribosyl)-5-amino-4-imidazole-carboxylate carboxylase, partial [Desulfobacteraceae bacterium]|nr:1-(5-phosphoribosyl)-5-amino-4-imidazole-carboxylate carboxylase [Desulfobacteraceae bacterium]
MDKNSLRELLICLSKGEITVDGCFEKLKTLPFEDLGFACIDHHRSLRRGISEVIYGEGKEVNEIAGIMEQMLGQGDNILVTRLSLEKAEVIRNRFQDSTYNERARVLTLIRGKIDISGRGKILV